VVFVCRCSGPRRPPCQGRRWRPGPGRAANAVGIRALDPRGAVTRGPERSVGGVWTADQG